MTSKLFVLCILVSTTLQGCNDSFEALGCQWKKPEGYTEKGVPRGYRYSISEKDKLTREIRYLVSTPKMEGILNSSSYEGELILQYYTLPEDSTFSAGTDYIVVSREGFTRVLLIIDEELDTFLVGCK